MFSVFFLWFYRNPDNNGRIPQRAARTGGGENRFGQKEGGPLPAPGHGAEMRKTADRAKGSREGGFGFSADFPGCGAKGRTRRVVYEKEVVFFSVGTEGLPHWGGFPKTGCLFRCAEGV